ncbi:MAG: LysR family transcriptional regulator [Lachnospiraceae bacterium]|jgi:DNA-binding transcriptional LysR family regulator|nr:LysR family transcriptional regulator [Lachnospiraceae bacterium]
MLGTKVETLLAVVKYQNFTRAAQALSMTQPAVSHQMRQLEEEVGAPLFVRNKAGLRLTPQGEIVVKYARRLTALNTKMHWELQNTENNLSVLRVGITHTSESNLTAATLAKCSSLHSGLKIILFTDTINNLYDMLGNYEIDLAILDGAFVDPHFSSMMLDTDYLMCVMSNSSPLARKGAVTLNELKKQKMILRTPASATRTLFESTLESNNESIENFNVTLEVDNIATIKDLIRKNLGVSILPRSACMDELKKGKLTALPIENLSMVRETKIIYNKDFSHMNILNEIIKIYGNTDL